MAARRSLLLTVLVALSISPAGAQATSQPADSVLPVGAVRLHYQVFGRGPAIVLIHGFAETLGSEAISPLLAPAHEMIRFDVPGFGTSSWSVPYTRFGEVITDDIVALLDHLHVSRADFVGTSMGTLLAARFAVAHPDRVHSLTLFDPMPLLQGTLGPVIDTLADDLDRGTMLSLINSLQPPGHRYTADEAAKLDRASFPAHDPHAWAAILRSFPVMQLTAREMHGLRMPIIAFSGDADPLHAGFMSSQSDFPSLHVLTVPGKGHGAMASSTEMRKLAVQFIDSVDAARPQ
jgi:pimeloyl-ACP methyl ester carboxylesterase